MFNTLFCAIPHYYAQLHFCSCLFEFLCMYTSGENFMEMAPLESTVL